PRGPSGRRSLACALTADNLSAYVLPARADSYKQGVKSAGGSPGTRFGVAQIRRNPASRGLCPHGLPSRGRPEIPEGDSAEPWHGTRLRMGVDLGPEQDDIRLLGGTSPSALQLSSSQLPRLGRSPRSRRMRLATPIFDLTRSPLARDRRLSRETGGK